MLRNARLILALSALTGISIAGVIGWATGFFGELTSAVGATWNDIMVWLEQPISWSHLFAGAGAIVIPLALLLALVLVVTDR